MSCSPVASVLESHVRTSTFAVEDAQAAQPARAVGKSGLGRVAQAGRRCVRQFRFDTSWGGGTLP